MVSVIIPSYNRGYCITKSIQSVLDQTYTDLEVLVIDDGSTDDTEKIVNSFKDKRIRYIKLETNQGVSNARNVGMQEARGDYIAFQDSDDYWASDKLEKQISSIKENDADFSYTYIKHILPDGKKVIVPDENGPLDEKNGDIYVRLLWENMVGAPTLLMKKICFESVGEFDINLPALEDWDYALRLAKNYKASFVPEALFEATYSEKSISRNVLHRLTATCMIVGKYKKDLMEHQIFNYQVENILKESQELGILDHIVPLLEKCVMM